MEIPDDGIPEDIHYEKELLEFFEALWPYVSHAPNPPEAAIRKRGCKYFFMGSQPHCTNGDTCTWSHHPSVAWEDYQGNAECQKWVLKYLIPGAFSRGRMDIRLKVLKNPHADVDLEGYWAAYWKKAIQLDRTRTAEKAIQLQQELEKERKEVHEEAQKKISEARDAELVRMNNLRTEIFTTQGKLLHRSEVEGHLLKLQALFPGAEATVGVGKLHQRLLSEPLTVPVLEDLMWTKETLITVKWILEFLLSSISFDSCCEKKKTRNQQRLDAAKAGVLSCDLHGFSRLLKTSDITLVLPTVNETNPHGSASNPGSGDTGPSGGMIVEMTTTVDNVAESTSDLYLQYEQCFLAEVDRQGECKAEFYRCCLDNAHPSLFQCLQCEERHFCVNCVQRHVQKPRFRTHRIEIYCVKCLEPTEDITRCVGCPPSSSLLCRDCQQLKHNRKSIGHLFVEVPFEHRDLFEYSAATTSKASTGPAAVEVGLSAAVVVDRSVSEQATYPNIPIPLLGGDEVPDATLQGQINNARVRNLLEDVVHPILVKALEVTWCTLGRNYCHGCTEKASLKMRVEHDFKDVSLDPCVYALIRHLDASHSAAVAYAKSQRRKDPSSQQFDNRVYDVTALCGILDGLCSLSRIQELVSANDRETIQSWRNATFHPTTLETSPRQIAFLNLTTCCKNIVETMKNIMKASPQAWFNEWIAKFYVEDRVSSCARSYTRLEIQEYVMREWQREILRMHDQEVTKIWMKFRSQSSGPSLELAKKMCSSDPIKILILPPFEAKPDIGTLLFLTHVKWVGIVDLNRDNIWNPDGNDFDPLMLIEEVGNELPATYGTSNILYVKNMIMALPTLISRIIGQKPLFIFVYAKGRFKAGDSAELDPLHVCLHQIDQLCQSMQWDHEVIPIFDEPSDLLNGTKFLWKKVRDANGTERLLSSPERLEIVARDCCSLDAVAAFILGNSQNSRCYLVNGLNDSTFGFDSSLFKQLDGSVEILTKDCDKWPPGYSALEEMCADEMTRLEDLKIRELESFLRGGAACWFLFKHGEVVARTQLETLIKMLKNKERSNIVTLLHRSGHGGTTIARHALYHLHSLGYVCMIINTEVLRQDKLKHLLNVVRSIISAMGSFLAQIIILIERPSRGVPVDLPVITKLINGVGQEFISCTFLTTAVLTSNSSDTDTRMVLNSNLDEREIALLETLVNKCAAGRPPLIIDQETFPVDAYGLLDIDAVMRSPKLLKIVTNSSKQKLISCGILVSDIRLLQRLTSRSVENMSTERSRGPKSWLSRGRKMPFLGVLAFLPICRSYVNGRYERIMETLHPAELRLLKLCIFYSLFTDHAVPRELAYVVYHEKLFLDLHCSLVPRGHALEDLLETRHDGSLSVHNVHLAYILAESSKVFGISHYSSSSSSATTIVADSETTKSSLILHLLTLQRYVDEQLLSVLAFKPDNNVVDISLNSSLRALRRKEQQFYDAVVDAAKPGFLDAFCNFKVWHPGNIPTVRAAFSNSKPGEMHNSYLLEYFLKQWRPPHDNFTMIKGWYSKLIEGFSGAERVQFATNSARFIAYGAECRKDISLIEDARSLVFDKYVPDYAVYDALGNICKREVIIYHKLQKSKGLSPENVATHISSEQTDHSRDGSPIRTVPKDPCVILNTVWDVALRGYYYFGKAVELSGFRNSYPMVAAAQTLVALLEYVEVVVCKDVGVGKTLGDVLANPKLCAKKYQSFVEKIDRDGVGDKCTVMLSRARSANLKSSDSGLYEHTLSTTKTNRLIEEYEHKLDNLLTPSNGHGYQVSPVTYQVSEARRLLIRGIRSSIADCPTALAWCLVTCGLFLANPSPVPGSASSNNSSRETELLYAEIRPEYDTLEKYFTASALLSSLLFRPNLEPSPHRELQRFLKDAASRHPGYSSFAALDADRLRTITMDWISYCSDSVNRGIAMSSPAVSIPNHDCCAQKEIEPERSFFGLEARLCLVMINVYRVLRNAGNTAFQNQLRDSTFELFEFTKDLSHATVPRIFLIENRIMEVNPFCCFVVIGVTELGANCMALKANPPEREKEYRKQKYSKLLKVLTGDCVVHESILRIHCIELGVHVGFDNKLYEGVIAEGDFVSFVMGLTDRGIRAYGIRKGM
jgi:hypothetical protein